METKTCQECEYVFLISIYESQLDVLFLPFLHASFSTKLLMMAPGVEKLCRPCRSCVPTNRNGKSKTPPLWQLSKIPRKSKTMWNHVEPTLTLTYWLFAVRNLAHLLPSVKTVHEKPGLERSRHM